MHDCLTHQTQLNQKVKIKYSAADLYQQSFGGAEGWVRDRKTDSHGYPMVFIEWDKTHWTYSAEPDGWTFDSHFEPVDEQPKVLQPKVDKVEVRSMAKNEPESIFEQFIEWYERTQGHNAGREPGPQDIGVEALKASKGFVLVTLADGKEGEPLVNAPTAAHVNVETREEILIIARELAKVSVAIVGEAIKRQDSEE